MIKNEPKSAYISIIIPVFNAAQFLEISILRVLEFVKKFPPNTYQFIFINDGSIDQTFDILNKYLGNRADFLIINNKINRGKGYILREGIKCAKGKIVGFTDADLPYGLEIIEKMMELFNEYPGLQLLYGSRKHSSSSVLSGYPFFRRMGSNFFSKVTNFLLSLNVDDTQCGVKLFSKKFANLIISTTVIDRFAFDIELFVIAKINNLMIRDIGVSLNHQKISSVRMIVDTFNMLKDILRIRFRLPKYIDKV